MKKTIVTLVVVVVAGFTTLIAISPAWRTSATLTVESFTQWTPEAIEKNATDDHCDFVSVLFCTVECATNTQGIRNFQRADIARH